MLTLPSRRALRRYCYEPFLSTGLYDPKLTPLPLSSCLLPYLLSSPHFLTYRPITF
nr:hypothetical protein Q903MT_gene4716 [Picea sitchensis]